MISKIFLTFMMLLKGTVPNKYYKKKLLTVKFYTTHRSRYILKLSIKLATFITISGAGI
jgi:hypothetical protein